MAPQPGSTLNRTSPLTSASSSSSGSNPESPRGLQDTETAPGAGGSVASVQQAGQQQGRQQQAGQGKIRQKLATQRQARPGEAARGQFGQGQARPGTSAPSTVRETTVRGYDPHASRAEQPQAAAGSPSYVREMTSRMPGSSGDRARQAEAEAAAAGPSSPMRETTVRTYESFTDKARQAQPAASEQSVAALGCRVGDVVIDDGPTLCRGPIGTTHHGGAAPASSSPVYGALGDKRIYTQEGRNLVLKLLDEGKNVYYVPKITNIIIKTVQKWHKQVQQGL